MQLLDIFLDYGHGSKPKTNKWAGYPMSEIVCFCMLTIRMQSPRQGTRKTRPHQNSGNNMEQTITGFLPAGLIQCKSQKRCNQQDLFPFQCVSNALSTSFKAWNLHGAERAHFGIDLALVMASQIPCVNCAIITSHDDSRTFRIFHHLGTTRW